MGMIRKLIGLVQMLAAMEEGAGGPGGAPTSMTTETRPIEPNDPGPNVRRFALSRLPLLATSQFTNWIWICQRDLLPLHRRTPRSPNLQRMDD